MKKLILLIGLLGMSGCALFQPPEPPAPIERVVYVTTPLQVPAAEKLPVWKGSEMSCLSKEMKRKILERDRLRKKRIDELTAIIKSTQLSIYPQK